jgi:SAM-dependent methyltransferase
VTYQFLKNLADRLLVRAPTTRNLIKTAYHTPAIKKFLTRLPLFRNLYHAVERRDCFDKFYGIDTSGIVPVELIHPDRSLTALICPYLGSRPAAVRSAFTALGNINEYSLVDIGCGKGRVTVIGTEFPFKEIIGVELSAKLAKDARRNARVIAKIHPNRPTITIHEANAIDFSLPKGRLVLFMYHAFRRELFTQLVAKLERRILSEGAHLYFVYNNPVCGDILDASPAFTRWYAELIPNDPMDYLPRGHDAIVVWQSVSGAIPTPHQRIDRRIVVVDPLWKSDLEA